MPQFKFALRKLSQIWSVMFVEASLQKCVFPSVWTKYCMIRPCFICHIVTVKTIWDFYGTQPGYEQAYLWTTKCRFRRLSHIWKHYCGNLHSTTFVTVWFRLGRMLKVLCLCCTEINYCASQPCYFGATCRPYPGSYDCICANDYTGPLCQTCMSSLAVQCFAATVATGWHRNTSNKKPSCCWDGPPFCDLQMTPKEHSRSKVMTHFY